MKSIADSHGLTVDELAAMFTSDKPVDRSRAYQTVGAHYGYHELAGDPDTKRKRELRQHYEKTHGKRYQ